MARRYFASPLPPAGRATLSPRLGHHLGRIVRTRPGDAVILFDGAGAEVHATVLEVGSRDLLVEVGSAVEPVRGRSPRIALQIACALPRSSRTDWLLAHGTEAGVGTFRPILTARTNRSPERGQHWRRILIEACAQCDRAVLPTIEAPVTLEQLCASPLPSERYVAALAPAELGAGVTETALLVVGPEGGLTENELGLLVDAGFAARSLGPLTLRTETAVIAGATRLQQRPGTA